MTEQQRQRLRAIKTFPQLIAFLRDDLDWPIDQGFDEDDLTFDWSDDLGLKDSERVCINEIKQLRPLETGQPWGIFYINFEKKQLPIVILRRILNALVMKKRASADKAQQAAWKQHDLLFISAYGEDASRQLTFAHFSEPADAEDASKAILRVLGWDDDDTNLKIDHVANQLKASLTWPTNPSDVPAWRKRWSAAFELRHRQVIDTAEDLAKQLAELAKRIRNRMLLVLPRESESGELRKLLKGFKTALIHDLTEAQFADMYAQTITYGLFSAAVSRTVPGAGTAVVQGNVVDMVPITNPFLKEMLASFLKAGGRKNKLDFDELGIQEVVDLLNDPHTKLEAVLRDFGNKTRGEDPVIHFYEKFLAAYDKKLKVQRGVFYTPQPVVSYIVRSVHELLQTEFGLEDGLADTTTWSEMLKKHPGLKLPPLTDEPGEKRTTSPDEPFVQILDPATGTATFLVEVIDVIYRTMTAKWKKSGLNDAARGVAWNDYVPKHLLPRLHAFELMMAPYAIAHMKIGLKLAETGYLFGSDERARIYLTNALEPWQKQLQLPEFEALAHEAEAVNEIKRCKRFTVVIGNPPYSKSSRNQGAWIASIMEEYKRTVRIEETQIQALSDDYSKFLRFGHFKLESSQLGILSYITNNGYIDGPLFRDMRSSMLRFFQDIRILNLHGDSRKLFSPPEGMADENVFEIQQGVAIGSFFRSTPLDATTKIGYGELWGTREERYAALLQKSSLDSALETLQPSPPFSLFTPVTKELEIEFHRGWHVYDVFGAGNREADNHESYGAGFVTQQDTFAVGFSARDPADNVAAFLSPNSDPDSLWERFGFCSTNQWDFDRAKRELKGLDIRSLTERCLYRPFDFRFTVFDRNICTIMRRRITSQFDQENVGLLATRRVTRLPFNNVFVSNVYTEYKVASHDRNTIVFPLWIYGEVESEGQGLFDDGRRLNLNQAFLRAFALQLNIQQSGTYGLPVGFTPEDIFHYAYAVFHSPTYRSRYAEFLKIDFPRLPLTGSLELFRALAQLGGELVALHLLESVRLDQPFTEFIGSQHEVSKVGYSDGTVWIDASGTKDKSKPGTSGFRGVPEVVWDFHIGGYQVCEKWLKDRKGRKLSADDIRHYHRIVVALSETIRLMAEIDRVIDKHGGWPGAFASTSAVGDPVPTFESDGFADEEAVPDESEYPAMNDEAAPGLFDDLDEQASQRSEPDTETSMAVIRDVLAKGPLSRDQLTRELALHYGYQRLGKNVAPILDNHIKTAVRRGIAESQRGLIRLFSTSVDQYERAFLKDQFLAALSATSQGFVSREDAVRAFSRWLGYGRVGSVIQETAKSLINGLLREGRLEAADDSIRRVKS